MSYGDIDATVMINGQDIEVNVEYEFTPGEPEQMYSQNGDPGNPGSGAEVSISVVIDEDGNDITNQIRSVDEERVIQRIIDKEQD